MREKGKNVLPKDFRGLVWAPSYEQEVVLLFGMLLTYFDEPIAVDECREAFPDCLAIQSRSGSALRIEFELNSSQFQPHGHDPKECDAIVCWRHDWTACPENLKVIELSRLIRERGLALVANPNESKYPSAVWDEDAFFEVAGPNPLGYVRELYDFCRSQPKLFEIVRGEGAKRATFNVKLRSAGAPQTEVLEVYATGEIWPIFDRLPRPVVDRYRSYFSQISRLKHKAQTKSWFKFVISDENELEVVKNSLRYLASVDWLSQ